jgi:hypothetical protein
MVLPALSPPDCHYNDKKKATVDELDARARANGYKKGYTEKKTVVETAINKRTIPGKIKKWNQVRA